MGNLQDVPARSREKARPEGESPAGTPWPMEKSVSQFAKGGRWSFFWKAGCSRGGKKLSRFPSFPAFSRFAQGSLLFVVGPKILNATDRFRGMQCGKLRVTQSLSP